MDQHSGQEFTIRDWAYGDQDAVLAAFGDPVVLRNLFAEPYPYTSQAARRFIDRAIAKQDGNVQHAIEVDGAVAGGLGYRALDDVRSHTIVIWYWLRQEYWGRGIGTGVVGQLCDTIFAMPNVARIQAGVFGWNPASCRVLEKNGFTLEGRLAKAICWHGEWTDELIYGRVR